MEFNVSIYPEGYEKTKQELLAAFPEEQRPGMMTTILTFLIQY